MIIRRERCREDSSNAPTIGTRTGAWTRDSQNANKNHQRQPPAHTCVLTTPPTSPMFQVQLYVITSSPPPPVAKAKYCDDLDCLSVCLSVREHISGTTVRSSPNFMRVITYVRGSVLLWRCCDMLCTSGFMGDVMLGDRFEFRHAELYHCRNHPGQVLCRSVKNLKNLNHSSIIRNLSVPV